MPRVTAIRQISSAEFGLLRGQAPNGFFNTLISLQVAIENFEATMAGLVLSSYFAGFTLAALRCGPIIERVGHIRAYAAFAGMVVAATAAMPLLLGPLPWLVLRAVVGFGCAGLFITTESWLNAKAEPAERGRIFSIYMVGTFLALALGQLLIGPAEIETAAPFNAIVALFAVALVMVSTTRAEPPRLTVGAHCLRWNAGASLGRGRDRRFADLPLEGAEFELPVPREISLRFRARPRRLTQPLAVDLP